MTNTFYHRIALKFRESPKLLDHVSMIRKVLEQMSDKEFKNRTDVNEVSPNIWKNNPTSPYEL